MFIYKQELLLTSILFVMLILVVFITKRAIKRFSFVKVIDINRRKVIFNVSYLFIYIAGGSFLAIIWGVDHKQFVVFISSILAVLGVGFFAQWSILSNLTASVILFFSHPMRIGDRIKVLDKDFNWSGEVKDITGFYLFMKTDDGCDITLPTSLVMQKGIEILGKEKTQLEEPKKQSS
ncbi:mechanosensitive ion channel family protein [Aquimarina sp. RZ0]|uniref:mechanosensitive ion channel domain-containing protein n=1 Tax=Aquimarina sp. RZ0 TaxID=2607730 RepID=UPI0011F324D5|nr:mechanosensitive ion channel family protein [Aquimarina sp. RZ0]KAA1242127.1 mechanosensitive ion channel family protein [Aquimarina sp. RZ0]